MAITDDELDTLQMMNREYEKRMRQMEKKFYGASCKVSFGGPDMTVNVTVYNPEMVKEIKSVLLVYTDKD